MFHSLDEKTEAQRSHWLESSLVGLWSLYISWPHNLSLDLCPQIIFSLHQPQNGAEDREYRSVMSASIALPENSGICLHICSLTEQSQRTCSTPLSKSGQCDPFPEKMLPSLQWESITPSHCILFELLLGKLFFCWTTKNAAWLHVYSFANHSAILNTIYPLSLTQMMDLATNYSLSMSAHTRTYHLYSHFLNQMWISIDQINCDVTFFPTIPWDPPHLI